MKIREPLVSDLINIKRLAAFYPNNALPAEINNVLTSGIIDGKDDILAFGLLKSFTEAIVLLNLKASDFLRAKAIKLLLEAAIEDAKKLDLEYIHLSTDDRELKNTLIRHYNFRPDSHMLIKEL